MLALFLDFLIFSAQVIGGVIGLILAIAIISWLFGALQLFKVNEGTGTAFKFLGKYSCSIMSLKDSHFGPAEFIEAGTGSSSTGTCWCVWRIGGWVFYISWFAEPTNYTDQNNKDGFGEGYSVFLNQIQRDFTLTKAETKKGEEIPLNLKAAFKMRVVNIYLFLFIAPKDVIAKVIEVMEAITRAWIKGYGYNEVQEVSSNGGKMWKEFGDDIKASIKKIQEDWGIEVLEESISIMDVGLLEEDQKSFAERKRQKLKTAAGAQEILGGMLENEALSMGLEGDLAKLTTGGDEARKELEKTPKGRKKLEAMVAKANQVVAQRALGIKPNLFGNADGTSLDSVTGTLAALISLAKGGAAPDNQPSAGPNNPGDKGGKSGKKSEDMTLEELEKEMDEED